MREDEKIVGLLRKLDAISELRTRLAQSNVEEVDLFIVCHYCYIFTVCLFRSTGFTRPVTVPSSTGTG